MLAVYLSYATADGYYRGNAKYHFKPGSLTALFRILQSNSYSTSYLSHILQLLYTQFSNPFPYPSSNHHFKVSFLCSGYYHHAIDQEILLPSRQPFFFSLTPIIALSNFSIKQNRVSVSPKNFKLEKSIKNLR